MFCLVRAQLSLEVGHRWWFSGEERDTLRFGHELFLNGIDKGCLTFQGANTSENAI